jgi:hypothetical protein
MLTQATYDLMRKIVSATTDDLEKGDVEISISSHHGLEGEATY